MSRVIGPTIALVAHTDTFAPAPGLATGGVDPATSVAAALEVARVLQRVMGQPQARGNYNVLLLITAGGKS